jgi:hypothetical protein
MTPASPVHKIFLTAAGLLLGIILYLFYFVGGFLTLAGFLVERATQPLPQAEAAQESGTMEQELLSFLEALDFGHITVIREEPLDRLVSLMTSEISERRDPRRIVDIRTLSLDLEPGEIRFHTDLVMDPPSSASFGRIRLRPFSIRLRTDFHILPENDGIILSFRNMSLSKLKLPERIAEGLFTALMPEQAGLPYTRVSRTSLSLPYSQLQQALPPVFRLEGLEARQDALAVELRIDRNLRETILNELSLLLQKEGSGFADAVAAAFPLGNEALKEASRHLAGLGKPEALIPRAPTALVSHVHGRVRGESANREGIQPVTGEEISGGTSVHTGTGASMELILRDGSVLKIGEETVLTLLELPAGKDQPTARFSLPEGSVRGRIAGENRPDYRFSTPAAEYRVTGTDLVLEVEKRQTRLSVLAGSVVCEPEKRPASEVAAEQQLTASLRELTRKENNALPSDPLQASEKERITQLLKLFSVPGDAEEIRETTRFWESLNAFKNVTSRIISLDEESRARLGTELEKRIDPEAIDQSFRRMMKNPDFAAIIDSYGIEGIPYP